ncbi:MAG: putative atp-dependent rna helicase, partial [Streblomastix strix]
MWGDVCVCSPTGSGKTLAYVVPIVDSLSENPVTTLRALVLVPTKELANQVAEVFNPFCQRLGLKLALASGQQQFENEMAQISSEQVDILVCTPGRLVDHINHNYTFSLEQLQYLVIDEADRLMSEEYSGWIEAIYTSISGNAHPMPLPIFSQEQIIQQSKNSIGNFIDWITPKQSSLNDIDMNILKQVDPQAAMMRNQWKRIQSKQINQSSYNQTKYKGSKSHLLNQFTLDSFRWNKPPLKTLLFSATLTQDPQKFAALRLDSPILIKSNKGAADVIHTIQQQQKVDVEKEQIIKESLDLDKIKENIEEQKQDQLLLSKDEEISDEENIDEQSTSQTSYNLPSQLDEYFVLSEAEEKPLVLLRILYLWLSGREVVQSNIVYRKEVKDWKSKQEQAFKKRRNKKQVKKQQQMKEVLDKDDISEQDDNQEELGNVSIRSQSPNTKQANKDSIILFKQPYVGQVIIFVKTKEAAHSLYLFLNMWRQINESVTLVNKQGLSRKQQKQQKKQQNISKKQKKMQKDVDKSGMQKDKDSDQEEEEGDEEEEDQKEIIQIISQTQSALQSRVQTPSLQTQQSQDLQLHDISMNVVEFSKNIPLQQKDRIYKQLKDLQQKAEQIALEILEKEKKMKENQKKGSEAQIKELQINTSQQQQTSSCNTSTESHQSPSQYIIPYQTNFINVIVSSDSLARGIDLTSISLVICYDTPSKIETYVHRMGRTARAGNTGTAITIVEPQQIRYFTQVIIKGIGRSPKKQVTEIMK